MKRKHFEIENEASQVGLKILTRPSTDFPLSYEKIYWRNNGR